MRRRSRPFDKQSFDQAVRSRLVHSNPHQQRPFGLPPAHRQNPVGGAFGQGLGPGKIVAKLGRFRFGILANDHFRGNDRLARKQGPDLPARLGIVGETFRQNIAGSGQGVLGGGNRLVLVLAHNHKLGRLDRGREARGLIHHEPIGEGFQPLLAGHRRAGPALGTVGCKPILQRCHGHSRGNFFLQLRGQQLALIQGFENRGPAGFQLEQLSHAIADIGNRHFVERAGDLFPVPGDEGNSGAFGQ